MRYQLRRAVDLTAEQKQSAVDCLFLDDPSDLNGMYASFVLDTETGVIVGVDHEDISPEDRNLSRSFWWVLDALNNLAADLDKERQEHKATKDELDRVEYLLARSYRVGIG